MLNTLRIYEELKETLEPNAAKKITEILGTIYEELKNTVTKEDFRELKAVVLELAEAQKKTEQRVEELAEAQKKTEQRVEELAEAQKKTEQRVEELAEAQKKTEQRVEELAEAQKKTEAEVAKLARGLHETRGELGGLSRSMSYAFENEAFRKLPDFLKQNYGIEIKQKLIREEIGGKEINIFGIARKNGKEVFVVGESKLRLDERKDRKIKEVFEELENKVRAVKQEYGSREVVKILITHYATKGFLNRAKEEGIIVIQSFEW